MDKGYKESPILVKDTLNLELNQVEYLRTLKNKSKYVRWLLDNDGGYQKHIKEGKDNGR